MSESNEERYARIKSILDGESTLSQRMGALDLEALRWVFEALTAQRRAVQHVLNMRQINPDIGYYISLGTESFDLLCAADAAFLGHALDVVRERRAKDLQPEYSKRRADVVEYREKYYAAQAKLEELEHG